MIFNVSGDGSMSMQEFVYLYNGWLTKVRYLPRIYLYNSTPQIVKPKSAIVIVDVQNDFISGSLAIKNCPAQQNGEDVRNSLSLSLSSDNHCTVQVVAPINHLLDTVPFNMHCYSLDWHPSDHVSFIDNVQDRKFHGDSKVVMCLVTIYPSTTFTDT